MIGGFIGSTMGVLAFGLLRRLGQIDLVIGLFYVVFLSGIGLLMLFESVRAILRRRRRGGPPLRKLHQHTWVHGLPLKMRFRTSRLYLSSLMPLPLRCALGHLAALRGGGGPSPHTGRSSDR